jgi:hypothetical protein
MKVRVLKQVEIGGRIYLPSTEILTVWPSTARKLIISGHLEDIEGSFLAAYKAKQSFKEKQIKKGK